MKYFQPFTLSIIASAILCTTLAFFFDWEICFKIFSILILLILFSDLFLFGKTLYQAQIKIKNCYCSVFLPISLFLIGLLWFGIGLYKSCVLHLSDIEYTFYNGALIIAVAIRYYVKHFYSFILSSTQVYIVDGEIVRKYDKHHIKLNCTSQGVLEVEEATRAHLYRIPLTEQEKEIVSNILSSNFNTDTP